MRGRPVESPGEGRVLAAGQVGVSGVCSAVSEPLVSIAHIGVPLGTHLDDKPPALSVAHDSPSWRNITGRVLPDRQPRGRKTEYGGLGRGGSRAQTVYQGICW